MKSDPGARRSKVFDDGSPIYRQIAERIRADILSGALAGDEQVMSTTQYATHYRINPATAAKAFGELVDEGVLYKRRGVGMFVGPDARDQLRSDHRSRFLDDVVAPMVTEAVAIGVPLEEVIAHVRDLWSDAVDRAGTTGITGAKDTTRTAGTSPRPDSEVRR
jgi:GntR family transcriptional regulator